MSLSRKKIFELASKKMRADFDELSSVPHSALKGAEAECILKTFLKDHLPKRFDVGTGFIIDPNERTSKQMDIVIYDALNCPIFRVSDNASIYPSDNVAIALEVKSVLTKKELEDSVRKIRSAKELAKSKGVEIHNIDSPDTPISPLSNERVNDLRQTLGIVFAFGSPLKLTTIADHLHRLIRNDGSLGGHVDLIVVLDKGIIGLSANVPNYQGWSPIFFSGMGGSQAEGVHLGVATYPLQEDTLDGFLRMIIPYLTFYRPIVSHPGFGWQNMKSEGRGIIRYLTSITYANDPDERADLLSRYAKEVQEAMSNPQVPKDLDI